jgi:hypothetical protein
MNRSKAVELIQSYLLNSNGLTIRKLSLLLCQDMNIPYRSAREDYVLPLTAHRFLIPLTDMSPYFVLNPQCHISKSGKIVFEKSVTSTDKQNGVKENVGKEKGNHTKTN